jgi:hypothetical protein
LQIRFHYLLTNNQDLVKICSMTKKQEKLTDQLKAAIMTADKSLGQIARESAIDIATISRFLHGKGGLSMDGLDRIADVLGVRLCKTKKTRVKKG